MTMYEMNFSLLVEDTLKNIVLPEYRQIIVEVNKPKSTPQHHRSARRERNQNTWSEIKSNYVCIDFYST